MALTKVKLRRRPTLLGWALVAILIYGLFYGFITNLYGFLAPEKPPQKGLMVIEGWIHDFALDEALVLFKNGNYSKIVCTGPQIETGSYIQNFESYPEMTAARLKKMGLDPARIVVTIADDATKDRTYMSAVALREAIIAYNLEEKNIHLVTVGAHGRRSLMLFNKALGEDYSIGVTSLDPSSYDPEEWCYCSEGVREVLGECLAYLYAKFLFHP